MLAAFLGMILRGSRVSTSGSYLRLGCRFRRLFLPKMMVSVLRTSDLRLFLRESQVSTSGSWPILGYTELALFLRGSCDPHIASWIRNGIMISMCELRLKLRSKMGVAETLGG